MTVMKLDTRWFIKMLHKTDVSQQQAESRCAGMLLTQAGLSAALVKLL